MDKLLIKSYSSIATLSFTIVVLLISTGFHLNSALGEKPAVCDSGDKSVNSTESKICGVPTTNETGTM
jgi:hypothetical protein